MLRSDWSLRNSIDKDFARMRVEKTSRYISSKRIKFTLEYSILKLDNSPFLIILFFLTLVFYLIYDFAISHV